MNSRECCFRTDGEPFEKVVWEVTFQCPLKCPYCFQERTLHKDRVDRSELGRIREGVYAFLSDIRPKHVLLSGGEPLTLGNGLFEAIEHIKSIGSSFSISTTGFPRTRFIRVLDYAPTGVNISIDPAGLEGQQYQYRKTKFETLKTTLQYVADKGIPVKGTSLVTADNLRNVPAYAAMIRQLAEDIPTLQTIFVTNPYHIGYMRPDLSVTPSEVGRFMDTIGGLDDIPTEIHFVNFSSVSSPLHECPAARSIVCIVPNGDVVGCPFLYQRSSGFAVGNVLDNEHKAIREALSKFAGIISQKVEQLLQLTPECGDCKVSQICHGGCFAESFAMKETSIPSLLCRQTVHGSKQRDGALVSLPLRIRTKLMTGKPQSHFEQQELLPGTEAMIAEHVHAYVKTTFSDIAHRYDHTECVVRLAKRIAKEEGANMRIVVPAAYFHDFAPRQHEAFHFHTDESADAAATFLADNGFDDDEIAAIVHCIVASEFSSYLLGIEPRTLEAKVVRDADWLEAIGARGIARVFSFGGKHCDRMGVVDYDPRNPKFAHHNIMAPDETPIQHFAAKLLRVNGLLQTEAGKKLGKARHKLMVEFLLQYREEMNADA